MNTGWTGGPFGAGKRISIRHTRALLNLALTGKLARVEFRADPVFGFQVPVECDGVPSQILDPAATGPNRDAYHRKCLTLAARFVENFKLMAQRCPAGVAEGGPRLVDARACGDAHDVRVHPHGSQKTLDFQH